MLHLHFIHELGRNCHFLMIATIPRRLTCPSNAFEQKHVNVVKRPTTFFFVSVSTNLVCGFSYVLFAWCALSPVTRSTNTVGPGRVKSGTNNLDFLTLTSGIREAYTRVLGCKSTVHGEVSKTHLQFDSFDVSDQVEADSHYRLRKP